MPYILDKPITKKQYMQARIYHRGSLALFSVLYGSKAMGIPARIYLTEAIANGNRSAEIKLDNLNYHLRSEK